MSKLPVLGATLAVLLSASACNPFGRPGAVEVSPRDSTFYSTWHANVASPSDLAGAIQMQGSASMAPSSDGTSTIVTLDLANASPGGVHPWEAARGQCGSPRDGRVFGYTAAYDPIEIDSNGTARATASIPTQPEDEGSYFIVVRASESNRDMVLACGNLAPPTR